MVTGCYREGLREWKSWTASDAYFVTDTFFHSLNFLSSHVYFLSCPCDFFFSKKVLNQKEHVKMHRVKGLWFERNQIGKT